MNSRRERPERSDFSATFSLALAAAVVALLLLIPLAIIWIEQLMSAPFPAGD